MQTGFISLVCPGVYVSIERAREAALSCERRRCHAGNGASCRTEGGRPRGRRGFGGGRARGGGDDGCVPVCMSIRSTCNPSTALPVGPHARRSLIIKPRMTSLVRGLSKTNPPLRLMCHDSCVCTSCGVAVQARRPHEIVGWTWRWRRSGHVSCAGEPELRV
jgi:hypothetical protein